MEFRLVGVVGCGQMGSGILQVVLQAGMSGVGVEADDELAERARQTVRRGFDKAVERGKLTAESAESAFARLEVTSDLQRLASCELVIEAVPEREEAKAAILSRLSGICGAGTAVVTNTSSLPVTRLMKHYSRPHRFAGLHFFNPVPVMRLVEVVATPLTEPELLDDLMTFAVALGKTPVRSPDRAGFLVNRLLIPYLLDAVRALEGAGSPQDLDQAMKLGCGHPMGPFELMDFIGLDTIVEIADVLYEESGESRMKAPPRLRRLVWSGRLGRKSGSGFYDYPTR